MLISGKVKFEDALLITKYTIVFSWKHRNSKTIFNQLKYFFPQKAKSLKAKKEEGNTAFKAGNLDEAYKLYRWDEES